MASKRTTKNGPEQSGPTMAQLLAGEYGEPLRNLARVRGETQAMTRQAMDENPLTDGEWLLWERALLGSVNDQHQEGLPAIAESEAEIACNADRAGKVGSLLQGKINEEFEPENEAHDAVHQDLVDVLKGLFRITEIRATADGRRLSEQESAEVMGIMKGFLDQLFQVQASQLDAMLVPYKGAAGKKAKNPTAIAKAEAMAAIKEEWLKRKRMGAKFTATAFAKDMATKHENIVTPEYLKNQQTKWSKEYHPAS